MNVVIEMVYKQQDIVNKQHLHVMERGDTVAFFYFVKDTNYFLNKRSILITANIIDCFNPITGTSP